ITASELLVVSACQSQPEPDPQRAGPAAVKDSAPGASARITPAAAPLRNEIPPDALATVMARHFQGLGHMEQYDYAKATEAFRDIHARAPGWIPGSINLAIALLNDTGVKAEAAKKSGADPGSANFGEALALLADVIAREPDNPYAHFCRGIIFEQQG